MVVVGRAQAPPPWETPPPRRPNPPPQVLTDSWGGVSHQDRLQSPPPPPPSPGTTPHMFMFEANYLPPGVPTCTLSTHQGGGYNQDNPSICHAVASASSFAAVAHASTLVPNAKKQTKLTSFFKCPSQWC